MFSPIEHICMHLRAHARVCMWLFVFIRLFSVLVVERTYCCNEDDNNAIYDYD